MGCGKLDLAHGVDGQINRIIDAQEQRAGILQAPAHIGDGETRVGGQLLPREMGLNDQGERMAGAVHRERSENLDLEVSLRQNLPLHLPWRKGNFRILGAFQDVFVHLVVARMAAAVAAGSVNHHQPAGMPRGGVEFHRPLLEFERTVNGMENIAQSKAHLGLRRIKFQYRFLRERRRCESRGQSAPKSGRKEFSESESSLVMGMWVREVEFSTGVGKQPPAQPEEIAEAKRQRRKSSGMSSQEPVE